MEVMNRHATTQAVPSELQERIDRARHTKYQARLIAGGQVLAAGPWRSDHLAAVVDRRRILDYLEEQAFTGTAEICSQIDAGGACLTPA